MVEIKSLEQLWQYTQKLHLQKFPNSKLSPIYGGGKTSKPKYMFLFINPTYRNISSSPEWLGKRRPWTGTKYIWRILNSAGMFSSGMLKEIEDKKSWDVAFADKVYNHIKDQSIYITNVVKWTGENADLPNAKKINLFKPILEKEIELVNPKYIIAFGLIPFKALTNLNIKLGEYYKGCLKNNKPEFFKSVINEESYKVIPCYYPVGRGNPKRAVELLKMLP